MELKAVIQNCLEGDQGAWEMLVQMYSKRVFNLAFQFTGSHPEAEDQTQEIFMKLHGALPKYDFERNFTAWLLTLAKNHLIDEYRRTKWERKNRDDFEDHFGRLPSSVTGPEQDMSLREIKERLWDALNTLSPEIRIAVILKEIQGNKYEEVAEIMGLPLGTVKSRINRGKLQLARVLGDHKEALSEM